MLLLERAAKQAGVELQGTMIVSGAPDTHRLAYVPEWLSVQQVVIPAKASWVPTAFLRLRKLLCSHDLVFDLGAGDSFASIYGTGPLFRQLLTKAAAVAARRPLVLAPQTLGPFSRSGTLAARLVTRCSTAVFCRDAASVDFCARKASAKVVADLAFALPWDLWPESADTRCRIGVNVSGLLAHARPDDRYFVPGYREYVAALLDSLTSRPDCEVHLVPHVVGLSEGTSDEDYGIATKLAGQYPSIVLPERFTDPRAAKSYISGLDLLVTSRMHAAIAAVSSGVPAVAVAYSRKFVDTFRTVGYDIPIVNLHETDPAAALDSTLAILAERHEFRVAAASAQERATKLLDQYVNELAELFADATRGRPRNSKPKTCVDRVVDSGMCIGCGACAALTPPGAITMEVSDDGFMVPRVEDPGAVAKVEHDFARVCPGLRVTGPKDRDSLTWGPAKASMTGHAVDEQMRFEASSGGAITALCAYLLHSGQADVVLTLAPDPGNPLRPMARLARTFEELESTAGSRYCPSSPVAALSETSPHERVAFVGKPCDVSALRQMMAIDPTLARRVVAVLSFFCAGIPSFKGTDMLVQKLGVEPSEVTALRYRGHGWPGRATVEAATGNASMSYHESWGGVLTSHRHPRCKICPDATGELADVACGDAWHDDGTGPVFDDAPGRSAILARTDSGMRLVREAEAAGFLVTAPFEIERLSLIQPYQRERKQSVVPRLVAARALGVRVPRFRRLGLARSALQLGPRGARQQAQGAAIRALRDHPKPWHDRLRKLVRRAR